MVPVELIRTGASIKVQVEKEKEVKSAFSF
jgi:hypothetical protein